MRELRETFVRLLRVYSQVSSGAWGQSIGTIQPDQKAGDGIAIWRTRGAVGLACVRDEVPYETLGIGDVVAIGTRDGKDKAIDDDLQFIRHAWPPDLGNMSVQIP